MNCMKRSLAMLMIIATMLACSGGKMSYSNIYDELVTSNLLYRFHIKTLPFIAISDYLKRNTSSIDHVFISIKIPKRREHFTEMISLGGEDIVLSDEQNIALLEGIDDFMKDQVDDRNAQLKFDLLLQFKMKDGSTVEINMETKTHGEWNRIAYGIFLKGGEPRRIVSGYRIRDAQGLEKFIAKFLVSLKREEHSEGVQLLKEIWPDLR